MYPFTKTLYISSDNLTISTEPTTIPYSLKLFVSKYQLDTALHSLLIKLKNLMQLGEQQLEE